MPPLEFHIHQDGPTVSFTDGWEAIYRALSQLISMAAQLPHVPPLLHLHLHSVLWPRSPPGLAVQSGQKLGFPFPASSGSRPLR